MKGRAILFAALLSWLVFRAVAQPPPALQPPRGEIAPTFWEQHGWQITVIVLANLILIGVVIILLIRPKPKISEPPEAFARRCLTALRGGTINGVLLMQVSQIFRRYVIYAFNLPREELTTTELQNALRSDVDADVLAAIVFLRQCDEGKFSPTGMPPNNDPASRALELLEKIEVRRRQSLPKETAA